MTPPGVPAVEGASVPTPREVASLDGAAWETWWLYNHEPYLSFGDALERLHPVTRAGDDGPQPGRRGLSEEVIYGDIVPALVGILTVERDETLVFETMMALARIGDRLDGERSFAPLIGEFLADDDQRLAELSALALGLHGGRDAAAMLAEVATDSEAGRKLCDDSRVSLRQRSFAVYGLGLAGRRAANADVARFCVHNVMAVLASAERDDLQVSCVIALGLVSPAAYAADSNAVAGGATARGAYSRSSVAEHLLALLVDKRTDEMVRAHAPTALARLLDDAPKELRERVIDALIDRTKKTFNEKDSVRQSCILALGRIGDADGDPVDARLRTALADAVKASGDQVAKSFALVALGQVGGRAGDGAGDPLEAAPKVARLLEKQLARGKSRLKPWAGLALGLLGNELGADGRLLSRGAADALLSKCGNSRSPSEVVAYALGAGLIHDGRAHDDVIERFEKLHDDGYRGDAALALGLMGDRRAIPTLTKTMDDSLHRPHLMERAAVGRALLGDRELVPDLLARLDTCHCWASTRGVARALGWTGDERAVAPLLAILEDVKRANHERASVAEALGWIADRSERPWDPGVAFGVNYAAAPSTLADPAGYDLLDTL